MPWTRRLQNCWHDKIKNGKKCFLDLTPVTGHSGLSVSVSARATLRSGPPRCAVACSPNWPVHLVLTPAIGVQARWAGTMADETDWDMKITEECLRKLKAAVTFDQAMEVATIMMNLRKTHKSDSCGMHR